MSAHVLLNLLNELRKGDKMRGLSSILSLFRKLHLLSDKNIFRPAFPVINVNKIFTCYCCSFSSD